MTQHGLRAVRPLADNTLARVARGMKRYVLDAERPFLVNLTHGGRCEDLADPFKTITGAHRGEKALVAPSITRFNSGATGQDLRQPMPTVTANIWIKKSGGAAPLGIIAPALATFYGHGNGRGIRASDLAEPLRTVTVENRHALIAPMLTHLYTSNTAGGEGYPLQPLKTITSGGQHHAMITPVLIQTGYGEAQGQAPRALDLHQPLGTVVAGGANHALIAPYVMTMRNSGKPFNGANEPTHTITAGGAGLSTVIASIMGCGGRAAQSRPRGLDEPMATVTSKADACLASAFLAQHNKGATGHDLSEPLSTIAATGSHQTPIAAWFAKYYGTGDGSRTDQPLHTVTVKDRMADMQADLRAPPFGPEHHTRAREVADFLRAHDAWGGGEFVTLTIDGQTFVIVDIGMRMLTPRELFNAQGFPRDYAIDGRWVEEAGEWHWKPFPKDIQVSCCGNSVCPDLARALVEANCQHLLQKEIAA